uniref:Zinc finger CCCH-type containing 15 n=1 Tax=Equus caballus TaxID=9796 RepID=A0A9L0THJ3_HORSE
MPPKKQAQAGGSKKAEQKKKEKIIEDKTFGLKNKKGAKQQKFIKAVTHQVKFGQQNPRQDLTYKCLDESSNHIRYVNHMLGTISYVMFVLFCCVD